MSYAALVQPARRRREIRSARQRRRLRPVAEQREQRPPARQQVLQPPALRHRHGLERQLHPARGGEVDQPIQRVDRQVAVGDDEIGGRQPRAPGRQPARRQLFEDRHRRHAENELAPGVERRAVAAARGGNPQHAAHVHAGRRGCGQDLPAERIAPDGADERHADV